MTSIDIKHFSHNWKLSVKEIIEDVNLLKMLHGTIFNDDFHLTQH